MEKQHPYNNIIENKLGQLPAADVNQLWAGMQGLLDKEMPQKKGKPRFFGWFMANRGLLLLTTISVLMICGFAFIHLSSKNSVATNMASSNSVSNKTILTDKKENTAVIRRKELPETWTTGTAVQTTNGKELPANALAETDTKPSHQKSYSSASAEKNGLNYQSVAEREDKKGSKFFEQSRSKKEALLYTDGNNAYQDGMMPVNHAGSAASLATASIDFTPGFTSTAGTYFWSDTVPARPNGLRDLLLRELDSAAKAGKKIKLNKSDKGLYVGIIAGVDLSSVKFESMRAGNNKGIIAGYAFNKRWSIETGFFWNKKRFFGDGIYFHPTGYTLPAGVEMQSVYGDNQLYEWPVNLKFNILPKKHSLFVTAGLSSYFMKTESCEYEYLFNGQAGKSYVSYKNETKDWFSVTNFSLGYAHKLGNIGTVRVEPYIKLPIRDIGITNMRVMSTGLNIGFTRQILK